MGQTCCCIIVLLSHQTWSHWESQTANECGTFSKGLQIRTLYCSPAPYGAFNALWNSPLQMYSNLDVFGIKCNNLSISYAWVSTLNSSLAGDWSRSGIHDMIFPCHLPDFSIALLQDYYFYNISKCVRKYRQNTVFLDYRKPNKRMNKMKSIDIAYTVHA